MPTRKHQKGEALIKAKEDERGVMPYTLRVPANVRDQLAAEAQKNRRSLNSEIIVRLEQSLQQPQNAEHKKGT